MKKHQTNTTASEAYTDYLRRVNGAGTTQDFARWAAWELHLKARDRRGRCCYCQSPTGANHAEDCPITQGLLLPSQSGPKSRKRYQYQLSCEICGAPFTAKSRLRKLCDLHRQVHRKESRHESNLREYERRRGTQKPPRKPDADSKNI